MKFNFRQISALATSALLVGMTAGIAAAANYPAPLVQGGVGDFAVVYGARGASTDQGQANLIASQLLGLTTSVGFGTDVVSLDTSSTKIYLNQSLNTAKSILTKTDLPSVLADYTFSGNVDSKMTATLKVGSGVAAGGDNSNKVIFARQPTSNEDPVIGISLGSNTANPLYNASVTMPAINFTHADSKGESIHLFGRDFVVSTETDLTDLVLFKAAQEVSLVAPTNPSTTLTIDGQTYTITLITGSGVASATINVNGEQRSVNAGASRRIGGLEVALKDVTESSALNTITATLLLGSQKMTFRDGSKVLVGSDEDPIDGTEVTITGGTNATTELRVSVFRPSSSDDAIIEGQSFIDPVFESFQVQFVGLSSPFSDPGRETISVSNSGDKSMVLTFTDSRANTGTIDFAHNESSAFKLRDSVNETIHVRDKINASENQYVVLGNEDYGFIAEITQISNNTGTDYTRDRVTLRDLMSGETYQTSFTAEGQGTLTIHGKQYGVRFEGDGDTGKVVFNSVDAGDTSIAAYPTIKTKNGGLLAFYEPLTINLNQIYATFAPGDLSEIKLPNGDGYTTAGLTYAFNRSGTPAGDSSWNVTVGGSVVGFINQTAAQTVDVTVGQLSYRLAGSAVNSTTLKLKTPAGAVMDGPAVVLFEGKDDDSDYHAVIVQLEENPAGTSTNGVGVNAILMTSPTQWSSTLRSNADITKYVDWWGTEATLDAGDSDQKTATINYNAEQAYADIKIGSIGEAETPQLGSVLVTDAEVSSVQSRNLIVVGGSCINSVAAALVGGAHCTTAWQSATGVGAGQFLIQSYASPYAGTKIALLVAGYEAGDTVNAATYVRNRPQPIDTAVGKKYIGTSATSAQLVVQ